MSRRCRPARLCRILSLTATATAVLYFGPPLSGAAAQAPPPSGIEQHRAAELAELFGALSHTRINISLDNVRAEDALDMLRQAIGVAISTRFTAERNGEVVVGINPDAPVTISFTDIAALDALEMILDQAVEIEPLSWQLRTGYIEVGTKSALMNHRERRLYHVGDLLYEPPDFKMPVMLAPMRLFGTLGGEHRQSDVSDGRQWHRNAPSSAANRRPGRLKIRDWSNRSGGVMELARIITEVVEPLRWAHHQSDAEEESPGRSGRDGLESAAASRSRHVATMDMFDDETLLVVAPDFMHRQINGYPDPIPPPPLTDGELEQRNNAARRGNSYIEVIGITGSGGAK